MHVGGEWDLVEESMPTAEDCVEITVCSIGDIEDKINSNKFNTPKVRNCGCRSVLSIPILIKNFDVIEIS